MPPPYRPSLFAVQQPNLSHPFHLHGYAFNVIGMGRSPDKNVKKINLKHALDLDRRGLLHRQFNLPPSKDTIAVPNNGYVVFRFRADNPGGLSTIPARSPSQSLQEPPVIGAIAEVTRLNRVSIDARAAPHADWPFESRPPSPPRRAFPVPNASAGRGGAGSRRGMRRDRAIAAPRCSQYRWCHRPAASGRTGPTPQGVSEKLKALGGSPADRNVKRGPSPGPALA